MANAVDTRSQLFQSLLGRPLTANDIGAVGGAGKLQAAYGDDSTNAQQQEITSSPEYLQHQQTIATNQYQPAYQQGLNALDLQGNQLDQNANDINNQYDSLGQTLTQNAQNAQKTFEERQNQLGLLQSGGTGTGIGQIGSDLVKSQNQSAQQKASQLANIALQRAGLTNSKAALTTNYTQNVNDAVQKLLQNNQATMTQNKNDAFQRLTAIPQIYNQLFTGSEPLPPELYNKIISGLQGAF